MEIAVNYYEQWLEDSSLYGDIKCQNKYMRCIIKQLSQPFAMREPRNSTTFQQQFLPLLMRILTIYDTFIVNRGKEFELDTWIVLLNTVIGITDYVIKFSLAPLCPEDKISEFRQKAVNLVFNTILFSGFEDATHWERVVKYCHRWSNNNDFITVWGVRTNELWKYFNLITFKLPVEDIPIKQGVFSETKKISDKVASDFFHHVVTCLDYSQITDKPELLLTVAKAISEAKDTAIKVAEQTSKTIEIHRYPAYSFLKLFGKFLTCAPVLSEAYDQAISINVITILHIISKFEFHEADSLIPRFIAYITQHANENHASVILSFLSQATIAYTNCGSVIPYVSSIALHLLANVQIAKQTDSQLTENIVSFFISAANSTGKGMGAIESAYDHLRTVCPSITDRYRLLTSCSTTGIDIIVALKEYCKKEKFNQYVTPNNYTFICSLIALIASIIRNDPTVIDIVIRNGLIQTILQNVGSIDSNKPNFDRIVLQTLLMVYEVIEWAPSAFHLQENSNALFEFISIINSTILGGRSQRSNTSLISISPDKGALGSAKSSKSDKHRQNHISYLVSSIQARLALHSSPIEHITRKFCSSHMFCEQTIIDHLKIKDPIIHYVTVGSNTLISFIETKECKDPLAFFARGPFGKAAYMIEDDYSNGKAPELSDEIQPTKLPKAEAIKPVPLELYGEEPKNVPYLSQAELTSVDDNLRKVYGEEFSRWTDWDKHAYYVPFNYKAPYQRLRIVDFLTTFGILDIENKNVVRPQVDVAAVDAVKKKFDQADNAPIVPIPIIHFMAGDLDLEYKQEKARMTPLLLSFLKEIGEPIELSAEASEFYKLPAVNTTVPTVPFLTAFATFFTPGMGATPHDSEKIHNLQKDAPIKIIFNESGFELNIPKDDKASSFLIVVKPLFSGLYQVDIVNSPPDILSPFTYTQVLNAKSLSINLTLALELLIHDIQKQICPSTPDARGKIIRELCPKDKKYPELAALAPGMFD